MFDIKPDDMISKTDMLLFDILQELKQINKSLRPIAKDVEIKKKPKPKPRPKPISLVKTETILEVQDGSNTTD